MKNKPSRQVQRARRATTLSTPQGQRGAAAVFGGVAVLALIIAMLLGINIGMFYNAQRDLQKQAVMAALSGAEVASGCRADAGSSGTPGSLTAVISRVQSSLANNIASTALLTGINGQPAVQIGKTDNSTSLHTFVALAEGNPAIDSVRVNLTRTSPSLFGGGLFPFAAPVTLMASATAEQPAFGNFSINTGLLNLNTANSALLGPLLSGLLGANVNLAVLNSSGLAQAQVSLASLELAAGVNNLNDLLSLNTNLTGALNILGNALSGTAGGAVSGLAGQAYNGGGGPVRQYFCDLFNNVGGSLNPPVTDALSAVPFVDGLDLLNALGQDAAQPGGPILISKNGGLLPLLNIPGLAGVSIYLDVIQPARFSVLQPAGPANTAQSAQLTLYVRLNINLLALATMNLGLDLNVPSAKGTLVSLQCPGATANPSATVVASTDVATLSVGSFDPNAAFPTLGHGSLISVLGGVLLNVTLTQQKLTVTVGDPLNQSTGPYDTYSSQSLAPKFLHQTQYTAIPPDNTASIVSSKLLTGTVGSLLGSLTSKNNLQVCTLLFICVGPLVDPLLNAISGLLTPITTALDSLLDALLKLLGIQVGIATVDMQEVLTGQPVIVTTALPTGS